MSDTYYTAGKHDYMLYPDDLFADFVFKAVSKSLDRSRYGEVVELGAGMGRFSGPLIRNFPKVLLVEPAPDYAALLRERFGGAGARVLAGDASQFFESGSFQGSTLIFCFHLLHHLTEEARNALTLNAAKKGHKLVIIEPNYLNPLFLLQLFLNPDMRWREEKNYLRLTGKYFAGLAASHGMRITAYRRFCFFPPGLTNWLLHRGMNGLLGFFEHFCGLCAGSYRVIIIE